MEDMWGTILIIGVVIAVSVTAALMIRRNPKYRTPPSTSRVVRIHNPRPRANLGSTGSSTPHRPIVTRAARRPTYNWDADRRGGSGSGVDPGLSFSHFGIVSDGDARTPSQGESHHSDHSSHDGGGYDSGGGDSGGGSDGGGGDGGGGGD